MTEDKLLNYEDGKLLYDDLRGRIDNKKTTPPGGKAGQVLKKKSNKSYDVRWADESGGVQDVQVDETSVVEDGIANINSVDVIYNGLPQVANKYYYYDNQKKSIRNLIGAIGETDYANASHGGVVRVDTTYGISLTQGYASIVRPTDDQIKNGTVNYAVLSPSTQHKAVFYGLAKAAGDASQASSTNAVGTYTYEAKQAIKSMLGIDLDEIAALVEVSLVENISDTDVVITGEPNTRYVCGEVSTISITPPSEGSIDVIFTSGSTVAILTLPNSVKMPDWFDATALETNTVYEIIITDGVYGSVMTWAS